MRKDVVPGNTTLAELRAYTQARVDPVVQLNTTDNRRDCGPVLRPGPTD